MSALTLGSLFTGIGGLDLGLERAGMRVVWQAENDPHCVRVLARHWPHVPNLGDVTLIDWTEVPRVDLLAGGYPCQPFSVAGRRLGEHDPRHLWPHMLDALRVLRPPWALLENVPGHLALGFGRVLGDLAEIGYDAEWDCIPAAAVGAHHRRDRVFIVAYPQRDEGRPQPVVVTGGLGASVAGHDGPHGRLAHPDGSAGRRPGDAEPGQGSGPHGVGALQPGGRGGLRLADTNRSGRDGRPRVFRPGRGPQPTHSGGWATEPDVGRVAHGVSARLDRLRALGNAVVPQVAEHIGRLIAEAAA